MPGDNAKHIFGERVPYEETVAPFSQYPFDLHFTQVSAGFPITRAPQASGLEKAAALDLLRHRKQRVERIPGLGVWGAVGPLWAASAPKSLVKGVEKRRVPADAQQACNQLEEIVLTSR